MSRCFKISLLFCLHSCLTFSTFHSPNGTYVGGLPCSKSVVFLLFDCPHVLPHYVKPCQVKPHESVAVNATGVEIVNLINLRLCPQRNFMWSFIFTGIFISHEHMIKSSEGNHRKSSLAPSLPLNNPTASLLVTSFKFTLASANLDLTVPGHSCNPGWQNYYCSWEHLDQLGTAFVDLNSQETTRQHATCHTGWSRWRTPEGAAGGRSMIHRPLLPGHLCSWRNVPASPCHRTRSTAGHAHTGRAGINIWLAEFQKAHCGFLSDAVNCIILFLTDKVSLDPVLFI